MLKIVSRNLSDVGRIVCVEGPRMVRPRNRPPTIRSAIRVFLVSREVDAAGVPKAVGRADSFRGKTAGARRLPGPRALPARLVSGVALAALPFVALPAAACVLAAIEPPRLEAARTRGSDAGAALVAGGERSRRVAIAIPPRGASHPLGLVAGADQLHDAVAGRRASSAPTGRTDGAAAALPAPPPPGLRSRRVDRASAAPMTVLSMVSPRGHPPKQHALRGAAIVPICAQHRALRRRALPGGVDPSAERR